MAVFKVKINSLCVTDYFCSALGYVRFGIWAYKGFTHFKYCLFAKYQFYKKKHSDEQEVEREEGETSDEDEYDNYENPFVEKFQTADSVKSATQDEDGIESSLNDTFEDNEFLKSQAQSNRPISAMPPKILRQNEAVVEVSSTPAFQSLEEVIKKKLILIKRP